MELDIIYVIPVLVIVGIIWFIYRLGIEVGRVMQRRDDIAEFRRHQNQLTAYTYSTNVRPLYDTPRVTITKEQSWHD